MAQRPHWNKTDAPEAEDRSRRFVSTLARGLEVLNAFTPDSGPLGNQEIARRAGLSKPTVSRITYTLTRLGYMTYVRELEKYQLSARVLSFGHAFLGSMTIADLADAHMHELAEATRGTVALAQRDGSDMVYVRIRRAVSRIMLWQEVGSRVPMAETAIGMAALAIMTEAERETAIGDLKRRYAADWPAVEARIARTGEEMRGHGFCVCAGTWEVEINGAATAFRHPQDNSVMGLNIGGPSSRLSRADLYERIGPRLPGILERIGVASPAAAPAAREG